MNYFVTATLSALHQEYGEAPRRDEREVVAESSPAPLLPVDSEPLRTGSTATGATATGASANRGTSTGTRALSGAGASTIGANIRGAVAVGASSRGSGTTSSNTPHGSLINNKTQKDDERTDRRYVDVDE